MQKFTDAIRAAVLQEAKDLNYWGKKLKEKRREVAGKIADLHTNGALVSEIMEWLDANKPAKAAKEPKAKVEKQPTEPTFTGSIASHYCNAIRLDHTGPVIIAGVQTNTAICDKAWQTMQALADELGAEILLSQVGYKVDKTDTGDTVKECHTAPIWLGESLILAGEVIPTAKKPVHHASLASGDRRLTILPHTKQQAASLPRAKGQPPRYAITTGVITLKRYRDGRAGAEAGLDHVIGFTVVYPDQTFDQVELDPVTGIGFYRGVKYGPLGLVNEVEIPPAVLVLGDIHAEKQDPEFWLKSLDLIGNLPSLSSIVIHDLHDFTSRNHHNRNTGLFLATQLGRSVTDDLQDALETLLDLIMVMPEKATIHVVCSNHDQALDRWLDDPAYDIRKDPINAPLWCKLNGIRFGDALESGKVSSEPLLAVALRDLAKSQQVDLSPVKFMALDESLILFGQELGQHGHNGANGAKGSPLAFERLGQRMITGHTHSPYKAGRVTVTGVTGDLDMGYNVGASSWDQCHVILTADGVAQLIKP